MLVERFVLTEIKIIIFYEMSQMPMTDIGMHDSECKNTYLSRFVSWSVLSCSQISFHFVRLILFFHLCQLLLKIFQLLRTFLVTSLHTSQITRCFNYLSNYTDQFIYLQPLSNAATTNRIKVQLNTR